MHKNPLLLLLFFLASPTLADSIWLANGDKLSGTIVSKEADTLILETDYAGRISLQWKQIRQIESTQAVTVLLKDDTRVTGTLLKAKDGGLRIKASELFESAPLDLSSISYINPPALANGKTVFSGHINVGINASNGNSQTEQAHLDGEMVARSQDNRVTIGGSFNHNSDSGKQTASNTIGYGKFDHFLDDKWYLYSNARFERDRFQDLKLRTTVGVGSGYQFLDNDRTQLSLEGGLDYFNEDFYTAQDKGFPAARWALKYAHIFYAQLEFYHNHEGYIGLENANDILLLTKTGVRVPIADNLSASAQFDLDWDNTPAPGKDKIDSRYLVNIGYNW